MVKANSSATMDNMFGVPRIALICRRTFRKSVKPVYRPRCHTLSPLKAKGMKYEVSPKKMPKGERYIEPAEITQITLKDTYQLIEKNFMYSDLSENTQDSKCCTARTDVMEADERNYGKETKKVQIIPRKLVEKSRTRLKYFHSAGCSAFTPFQENKITKKSSKTTLKHRMYFQKAVKARKDAILNLIRAREQTPSTIKRMNANGKASPKKHVGSLKSILRHDRKASFHEKKVESPVKPNGLPKAEKIVSFSNSIDTAPIQRWNKRCKKMAIDAMTTKKACKVTLEMNRYKLNEMEVDPSSKKYLAIEYYGRTDHIKKSVKETVEKLNAEMFARPNHPVHPVCPPSPMDCSEDINISYDESSSEESQED